MTKVQRGVSTVEVVLIVIIIGLVVFTGWYSLNAKKNTNKTLTSANKSSQTKLTKDQIAAAQIAPIQTAVREHNPDLVKANPRLDVRVTEINGDNARGTIGASDGAIPFIAHRDNSGWSVISQGQTKPGKADGLKYNLPASWYSTDY